MKIISWNVASLRALKTKKEKWLLKLLEENPDIICLQETKLQEHHEDTFTEYFSDYNCYWNSCISRKGLHGTAILVKKHIPIIKVVRGFGDSRFDSEGRCITLYLEKYIIVNTYVPNSGENFKRLKYRLKWGKYLRMYIRNLMKVNHVIWAGDLNVAYQDIDIHNPQLGENRVGFSVEEKKDFSEYLKFMFDSFRKLNPTKQEFTYWSYLGGDRFDTSSNVEGKGWRLDYFLLDNRINSEYESSINKFIFGSDHCPIILSI